VEGCCEHGNEPSGSIIGGGFLYQLSEYQILKKDFITLNTNNNKNNNGFIIR
jgi:hypothetical protein